MIDYQKLKIAHELTKILPFTSYSFDCWCCTGFESSFFYTLTFEDNENIIHEYESENIDDLIKKLQELTKKQSKYKMGQKVYYLDLPTSVIYSSVIQKINDDEYEITGEINGTKNYFLENELFETKEELIKSQVNFWIKNLSEYLSINCQHQQNTRSFDGVTHMCIDCNQLFKQDEECQHKSDGVNYGNTEFYPFARLKCKKCGEFYK